MVVKEELLEKFQITGCDNLSDEILEKCIELCHWYNIDEEELVNMWVAFGVGHLDGNLEPTVRALDEMKHVTPRNINRNPDTSNRTQPEQRDRYSIPSTSNAPMDVDESEIVGMYATPDQLAVLAPGPRSPDLEDSGPSGCKEEEARSPQTGECTLPPLEPNNTTTATQLTSTQSGKILSTFGTKISTWVNNKKMRYLIRRAGPHVPKDARYMFELLKSTSDIRTRACRSIGQRINAVWAEQKKDDMLVTWNVRTKQQKSYRTWGRVCFDSENKQSNPTAMLEGCRKPPKSNNVDAKLWPLVELDVSDLRECCLFPGQIVAVEGLNLTESLMKVHDIFTSGFIPAANPPSLVDELKIIVAAGPFTHSNDLDYRPLWELMDKVAEDEPHLLVLIGPFLDYNHPNFQDDELVVPYQEYFDRLISRVKSYLAGKCTQVVLVASNRDAHHHPVYPTPEYSLHKSVQSPDIHVLPDPCTLDINGLRLGITSIDCLMHLARSEVALTQSSPDKLTRLGNYILNQACYYPLYPPAKEINVDSELWEKYAFLNEKPHVLFLPSDMRHFCKSINDSVILNPERLSKRTYARMHIEPPMGNGWSKDNITCEIIKM
ncbi:DNA polymerase alpha subunit B isoform X4 [Nasonia vitripennis]|uniref:DNA polymerase alpha subunit B n=1 Tax=Nasonia vitripennis TaxID=7425 RepID=A0A7M7H4F6_NASVI|nr:DNA polymerase alpha subunit B isoform X4 [Nasonia vitripennis]